MIYERYGMRDVESDGRLGLEQVGEERVAWSSMDAHRRTLPVSISGSSSSGVRITVSLFGYFGSRGRRRWERGCIDRILSSLQMRNCDSFASDLRLIS
jgi:hypothetical protein